MFLDPKYLTFYYVNEDKQKALRYLIKETGLTGEFLTHSWPLVQTVNIPTETRDVLVYWNTRGSVTKEEQQKSSDSRLILYVDENKCLGKHTLFPSLQDPAWKLFQRAEIDSELRVLIYQYFTADIIPSMC